MGGAVVIVHPAGQPEEEFVPLGLSAERPRPASSTHVQPLPLIMPHARVQPMA